MAERLTPFGKYFLLERINVGGMAEVYKAKTVGVEGFEKIVAIKRILPSVAEDEEFIRMFVDEAKITSQLSHANLAQTFDLGKIQDTYYIAMEYVPGKDLRAVFERLKRRGERMPLTLAAYVLARVCEGLDYAHRKRDLAGRDLHIVHRDVSPQNVILSFEGEVKLIDFGIAKAANKMTKTQAGILKGKFGYMSPEQVRGLGLDGRSDIFAAGIVLYELCTGERLFTGTSDYSVLEKVQQAKVTPPHAVEPSIPLKLERVILKALAREPEGRYQQAADLAADLQRFLLDSRERPVTRDDVAGFMKAMFPDDNAREAQAAMDSSRPRELRRPPPDLGKKPDEIVGESDPDRTYRGPMPEGPRAEIIVRSKVANLADLDRLDDLRNTPHQVQRIPQRQVSPALQSPLDVLPPMPRLPLLFGGLDDSVSSSISVEQPGESPTRPMSMDELAAAEREFVALQKTRALAPQAEPTFDEDEEPTPAELSTPTLVGDDPVLADEDTVSTAARRARVFRFVQYGIVTVALAVALWALLSSPRPSSKPAAGPPPMASLKAGEERTVVLQLVAAENAIVVRSSPPGAQIWIDGARRGQTPAYLPDLSAAQSHAIVLEKKCYRAWQVALPAHAGRREFAATLEPAARACPGRRLEKSEGMPAPEVPDQVQGALGLLSIGSRPSANVLIDGIDIGRTTPLLSWPLKPGGHRIRLASKGNGNEVAVEIRSGETHSEIIDLLGPAAAQKRGRR